MGVVYRGEEATLKCTVAPKFLPAERDHRAVTKGNFIKQWTHSWKEAVMRIHFFISLLLLIVIGCAQNGGSLSAVEKAAIEKEITAQIDSLNKAFESADPDRLFTRFLHTDDLAVASEGTILAGPDAVLDTIRVHLATMEKQTISTKVVKIYVITRDAAVVSAVFTTDIQFKNGAQVKDIPYALTMLLVRTDNGWKIAHYHN